ncbi:gluconate 2-dehydrogenase subunit 3 family protein [Conexibacter sp. DBS9H8]|uniref:gluconate 2-dehydrogenase subunit 3 family protein n=1 Tax=Conexibacter sp. DBS9H8 TaxID=2937801 RepID=UPI00200BEF4D|nr:gluconate 2-dehydrogenase subunit 3 family protein [Conexibacter sp. DBS9H8]
MSHSYREADHLPHHRRHGDPPDPRGLPRQRVGITPQMHGRYPDFDVMAGRRHWDEVTRRALVDRVEAVPACRFFTAGEQRTLRAFLDVVLAQDDDPRIPVLEMIDAKLADGRLDGYRYENMPPDPEVWRRVAAHLDGFDSLDPDARREVVARFAEGDLVWKNLDVSRAWGVVMRGALAAFYSHPWAFNEIGFRGPAYPRGYMRRNMGPTGVDPGEPREAFGLDPVRDLRERA